MKKELTPEQQKQIDKLGLKFLLSSIFNTFHHVVMLIAMNFIIATASVLLESKFVLYAGAIGAGIFVFRRMMSIAKESHDRLIQEAKKITDQ